MCAPASVSECVCVHACVCVRVCVRVCAHVCACVCTTTCVKRFMYPIFTCMPVFLVTCHPSADEVVKLFSAAFATQSTARLERDPTGDQATDKVIHGERAFRFEPFRIRVVCVDYCAGNLNPEEDFAVPFKPKSLQKKYTQLIAHVSIFKQMATASTCKSISNKMILILRFCDSSERRGWAQPLQKKTKRMKTYHQIWTVLINVRRHVKTPRP